MDDVCQDQKLRSHTEDADNNTVTEVWEVGGAW